MQLGSTVFNGLRGFNTLGRQRAVTLSEMPLIGAKPRLQRTGEELAKLNITITLGAEWYPDNLVTVIDGLYASMAAGDVLPLIGGDGIVWGDFIIQDISDVVDDIHPTNGTLVGASLTLSLVEWVDPDPGATERKKAAANGFATDVTKVVPVSVLTPGETLQSKTVKSIRSQQSGAIEAGKIVQKVRTTPSEKTALWAAGLAKIDWTRVNVQELILDLLRNPALGEAAPGLLDAAYKVTQQADQLRIEMLNDNLTGALAASAQLDEDISVLKIAALPLDAKVLQRK